MSVCVCVLRSLLPFFSDAHYLSCSARGLWVVTNSRPQAGVPRPGIYAGLLLARATPHKSHPPSPPVHSHTIPHPMCGLPYLSGCRARAGVRFGSMREAW